jgi:hypothetical protein
MIGKGGSKIRETKQTTGAEIQFDKRYSQFVVTGRVGACDKAIDSLSSQLAHLMEREIERQQRKAQRKFVPRRHHQTTSSPKTKTKTKTSRPKNAFSGLVSEDGRTFEKVEEDAAAEAKAAADARRAAKAKKQKDIQDNQNSLGLVGITWGDSIAPWDDTDDEEDDVVNPPSQPRYNRRDGISFEDWQSEQKSTAAPATSQIPAHRLELHAKSGEQKHIKEKNHDQKPYGW